MSIVYMSQSRDIPVSYTHLDVYKRQGETVNFWMPFTDKIGIYGKAGLDVTGYDFSDDADIAAFGSDDESSGTSVFSDSWPGIEGCIAVPEEQAQAIYQTVESGIPVVIYK